MTWTTEEEGKVFTMVIGGSFKNSRVESKSLPSVFISWNSTLDVLVSNFNTMHSYAYHSFHSSPFKCFTSYGENEDITPIDLIKVVEA